MSLKGLEERNRVRKRFGFPPMTETEYKLDQKGLKVTYHNPDGAFGEVFEFSPGPFSNAKQQVVSAESLDKAVDELD